MEARSYEPGSLAFAKSLVRDADASISRIAQPSDDLLVSLLSARGSVAIVENDARAAEESFAGALSRAQMNSHFNDAARARMKQTLAFSYIRLGDGAKAEPLLREVIAVFTRADGPDSPAVLKARVNLSQALMVQRKYAEAIQEANLLYPLLVQKLGEDHEAL